MNNGSIVFVTGTSQGQKILSWSDIKIRVSVNNSSLGDITLTVGGRNAMLYRLKSRISLMIYMILSHRIYQKRKYLYTLAYPKNAG